jgi:hypothetical protein
MTLDPIAAQRFAQFPAISSLPSESLDEPRRSKRQSS